MEIKTLRHILNEKLKTAMPILLFIPVYLVWFKIIELVPFRYCYRTDIGLDDALPFIKYFIVPYFAWFAYIPAVGVYLLFGDEKEFKSFSRMMISGMVIFLVLNTFFPTAVSLRPAYIGKADFFGKLVAYLYSIDTSTNVFPSIHVYTTVTALVCLNRSRTRLVEERIKRTAVGLISVCIILATVFLKQHSLLDVIFGFIMCACINHANNRTMSRGATKYCEVTD